MKPVPVSRLDELAGQRAQLVERLQAIDDEAAEIVQGLQAQAQEAVTAWPHVVPKPPPVTRKLQPDLDLIVKRG